MTRNRPRVLCIEDHSAYLAVMTDCLERLPAEIDGARTGQEAVDRLIAARHANKPYDLVVIDMYVPKEFGDQIAVDATGNPVQMDEQKFGLQMLMQWQAEYKLIPAETPIIVYTGFPSDEDRLQCLRAGAFSYVPKRDGEGHDQLKVLLDRCREALANSAASQNGLNG